MFDLFLFREQLKSGTAGFFFFLAKIERRDGNVIALCTENRRLVKFAADDNIN
jgi:hypothetical protein